MKAKIYLLTNKTKDESFDDLVATGISVIHSKPFVVTEEFEVGDEVTYLFDYPETHIAKGECDKYCFKILGEVSPDAKWVKEGDEVDAEKAYQLLHHPTREVLDGYGDKPEQKIRKGFRYEEKNHFVIKCTCCGDYK